MKKLILLLIISLSVTFTANAQEGQHILKQGYSVDFFAETILEPDAWVPYPGINDSEKWKSLLPAQKYAAVVENAEKYLDYQWPLLRATVFLDYVEDGNRTRFQNLTFSRREALTALAIGELVEGKGRFIEDIVDGIWAVAEETFWGLPAALTLQKRGHGLPDVTEPVVELFSAETAAMLAWISYLLGDQLDVVHPMITERIYLEIDRRIFKVIESEPNYRWMGYNRDADDPSWSYSRRSFMQRRPNNWNPWISSNLLTSILLLETDPVRRAAFVHQVFDILDNYVEPFPADGGSDEGTGYWGHAAGSLFECLDLVAMATGHALPFFDEPLFRNMGEFLPRAYIGNGYYVNFADASPRSHHSPMLIYRFGKAVDSRPMTEMGAHLAVQGEFEQSVPEGRSLLRILPELYFSKELLAAPARESLIPDNWWPDIQVMVSRDREDTTDGLFLAAKAGHNEESHNHNDVGSFMVYQDGKPAIIDVGSATYTANYGNEWIRDSAFHNLLPVIDGAGQQNGMKYAARNVSYTKSQDQIVFSQDFADAYSDESGLTQWERVITHHKGKSIVISDRYEFAVSPGSVRLPLMLLSAPDVSSAGSISVETGSGKKIVIGYDSEQFEIEVEEISLQDEKLSDRWNEVLYRVFFTVIDPHSTGAHEFFIQQESN